MSIFSRKRDLAYLVFFIIHIPVMFCVDLAPIYPASIKPQFISDIRTFYVDTYQDKFFISPPAWFNLYLGMELLYHTPLSIWAVGALLRDDPKLPIHLLAFAVQTCLTTSTCIAEYLSWDDFSYAQKVELGKLYIPYLALSVYMGIDMYVRLSAAVGHRGRLGSGKKSL